MSPYNLSNLSSSPGIYDAVLFINEQTEGVFVFGFVLAIFIMIFIGTKAYESKRSFAASAFITTIVCVFLSIAGLLSVYVTGVAVIITAGAAIMLHFENG